MDVTIDKQGFNVPKGHMRTDHHLIVTPSKIDEVERWVQQHYKTGDLVRLQSHYQEAKVTLDHWPLITDKVRAQQEKAQAQVEAQIEASNAEQQAANDAALAAQVSPEIFAWYKQCAEINEQIEAQSELVQHLETQHRAGFVAKLSTAEVAAAALRYLAARVAGDIHSWINYAGTYYDRQQAYLRAVLGITTETWPWATNTQEAIYAWINADKKRVTLAAALLLMPATRGRVESLETQFDEQLAALAAEEGVEILKFPTAPDSLNAMLTQAQGFTFEEANEEITWNAIENTVWALADGEFDVPDPEPSQEEPDADANAE